MQVNDISGIVLDESIRVHREIGPGVLESVYEAILAKRLVKRGLVVERQRIVPLMVRNSERSSGAICSSTDWSLSN